MKSGRNIEKIIRNINVMPDARMDKRTLDDIFLAQEKTKKTYSALVEPNVWSIIMKSKITKFATATVIIIGVFFALEFVSESGTTGVVYGISDVPELLNSAKTLHIKGNHVYHLQGQEPISCPYECWIDFEKGGHRESYLRRKRVKDRYIDDYYFVEYVQENNSEYTMEINHTDKSVEYLKTIPFLQRLSERRNKEDGKIGLYQKLLKSFYLKEDQLDDFILSGQEEIDGTMFDVWEKNDGAVKVKYWISPSTGQIGRYVRQHLYDPYKYDRLRGEKTIDKTKRDELHEDIINIIERDVTFPYDLFKVELSNDYTIKRSKENARVWSLRKYRIFNITVPIVCILEDGSVIVGWSYWNDESGKSQEDLFADLQIGGPVPKLTYEFYALHRYLLEPIPEKLNSSRMIGNIVYSGHHLAYTQKANRYYEWSIYVPDSQPPKEKPPTFHVQIRNNLDNTTTQTGLWPDIVITSAEDFDTFVLGAMAEFSDDGMAPEGITYDGVLDLAQQIRESLDEYGST